MCEVTDKEQKMETITVALIFAVMLAVSIVVLKPKKEEHPLDTDPNNRVERFLEGFRETTAMVE